MRAIAVAGIVLLCVVASTSAMPRPIDQGQAPQNLQVLPKDMTRMQVTTLMRTFTVGLGVQCTHCHVEDNTKRFVDEKPTKATARKMIAMVQAINGTHLAGVGEPPAAGTQKVTCFTCHRGTTKPLTAPPAGGGY